MTLPRWMDEERVYALVQDILLEIEYHDAIDAAEREEPDLTLSHFYEVLETQALDKARQGSFHALASLLRSDHPLNWRTVLAPEGALRASLSDSTWDLIAARLSRKFKAERRGAPQKTRTERETGTLA